MHSVECSESVRTIKKQWYFTLSITNMESSAATPSKAIVNTKISRFALALSSIIFYRLNFFFYHPIIVTLVKLHVPFCLVLAAPLNACVLWL